MKYKIKISGNDFEHEQEITEFQRNRIMNFLLTGLIEKDTVSVGEKHE